MIKRYTFALIVGFFVALGAFAQPSASNTLVPSRVDLCAGDTFSLALTTGSFSGVGQETVIIQTTDFSGIVDTLYYAQLGSRLVCQLPKSTVGSTNYSVRVHTSVNTYTSGSRLRILNPMTAAVPDSAYSYCFTHAGHIYFRYRHKSIQPFAFSLAHRSGGKLVTIGDSILNNKLASFSDTAGHWIDLSDRLVQNVWRRNNMQPNYYINWAPLEPNNAGDHEDYAVIRHTGLWNDEFLERPKGHFLEINTVGGDTLFTVPGGALRLAAPAIAQAQVYWFGPNSFFSSDTLLNLPRIYIPVAGGLSENFGLIVRKDGCQSELMSYPVSSRIASFDTALFVEGPSFHGHRYYASKFNVTQPRASEIAYLLGGLLAEVRDQAENSVVMGLLPSDEKWIGISDTAQNRVFRYLSSDTLATYLNWSPGEPNNHLGREPYVEMRANGRWNDIFPELSIPFVMQVKESITLEDPADLTICQGSRDSLIFHSTGLAQDCQLQLSDASGSFDSPQKISFTSVGNRISFGYPVALPLGTNYHVRLVDTVRGLYDYPNPTSIEVSNGDFIKPLLAQVDDSIYILNPYPATHYSWYFNGVLQPSSDLYIIGSASGSYSAQATHNACQSTSEALQYISTAANTLRESHIRLYPNPASNLVQIELPGVVEFQVYLVDVNGRIVKSASSNTTTMQLALAEVAPGIYQVLIRSGSFQIRKKLAIK